MLTHRRVPLCYFIFFKYASTARLKSSAIGAPVFADSFLSFARISSGSQTVVRFFTLPILQCMSIYVNPIGIERQVNLRTASRASMVKRMTFELARAFDVKLVPDDVVSALLYGSLLFTDVA